MPLTPKQIVRFWSNVDKTGDCWIWMKFKIVTGYGKVRVGKHGGILYYTHRLSYELTNGAIPKGLSVCHHCDNPSCVRPEHLFLGTQKDNIRDAIEKGRKAVRRGSANWFSKLTDESVIAIRSLAASGVKTHDIAASFHVGDDTVRSIVTKTTWRHL